MIAFPTPSNKVAGLSLPDFWRCKRNYQPWLKGLVGSASQILSDATIFGHQGSYAVSGMLKEWEVLKGVQTNRNPGWISNTEPSRDSLKPLEEKEWRSFLWAVGHRSRVNEDSK